MAKPLAFVGAKVTGGNPHVSVVKLIIKTLEGFGFEVPSQHNGSENPLETFRKYIGDPNACEENHFRDKDYEWIEQSVLAVYEITHSSSGVGAEFEHTRMKPRLGLRKTPILCLYDTDADRNFLSPMIGGVSKDEDHIWIREYHSSSHVSEILTTFVDHFFGTAA